MYSTVHRVPADVQNACTPVRYTVPVYSERTEYSPAYMNAYVYTNGVYTYGAVYTYRALYEYSGTYGAYVYAYRNGAYAYGGRTGYSRTGTALYAYSSGSYVNSARRYAYSIRPDRQSKSSPAFIRRCGVEPGTDRARARHMHAVISRDSRRHSPNVTRGSVGGMERGFVGSRSRTGRQIYALVRGSIF